MSSAHVVSFYRDDAELIADASSFLTTALLDGGTAVVAGTPSERRGMFAALSVRHSPSRLREGYRSFDAAEVLTRFMRDDRPDRDRFGAVVDVMLDGAAGPLRVFGSMVALLWNAGNFAAAIELESLWNDRMSRGDLELYCGYPITSLEPVGALAAAKQVCDRHSNVFALDQNAVPDPVDPVEVARRYVPAASTLRDVRRFVAHVLVTWGLGPLADDVQLIASELASNAVLHAESPFCVTVRRTAFAVTVSVRDASNAPPLVRVGGPDATGGRGMALVASLADRWTSRQESDGKTVSVDITA